MIAIVDIPPGLQWPAKFCLTVTAGTYALSVVTGNVSQVDRVWTFLPTIYTAYFALSPLWQSESWKAVGMGDFKPRALLMLALVVLWMIRLSYNTWRRGLFNPKDEDYRWIVLRNKLPTLLFQILNLVFIAAIQNIILLLLGMPTYFAANQVDTTLATSDYVLAVLALITLVVEFTSDNQQYSFQTYKRSGVLEKNEWYGARIQWTPEDAKRGFVTKGLWGWSRHPNFLCEQTFWIIITLFPLLAPGDPKLPTTPFSSLASFSPLLPAIVLCSLFYSSTLFTESISLGKYPVAYHAYQKRVAMFVPLMTPVWGVILMLQGKKVELDGVLYGISNDRVKAM